MYTSPHIVRVEERIRIGDEIIPQKDFCRALTAVREGAEALLVSGGLGHPPTFFEVLTAAALLHFAQETVDFAVLEVGMGGRFDATNTVTPLLSVITTVSMDHQKYLGRTLGAIAFEKAGIIKDGVPRRLRCSRGNGPSGDPQEGPGTPGSRRRGLRPGDGVRRPPGQGRLQVRV